MTSIAGDLRYALRTFARSPGFAAAAVATLALGIGANTAVFSAVSAVLLRPLPYPEPQAIVDLSESNPTRGWKRFGVSPASFLQWRNRTDTFEAAAVFLEKDGVLSGEGEPERIPFATVSAGIFDVLGVRPAKGRAFSLEEDRPGAPGVVVLSHGFWKSHLGGDETALGRTVRLDGRLCTIVGVLPEGVSFPSAEVDLWLPAGLPADGGPDRQARYLEAAARLKAGVSVREASARLATVARRMEAADPENHRGWGVTVTPWGDRVAGDLKTKLLLLQVFVTIVLAIACANVASLLLARGVARRAELALRYALGADTTRIARQLLLESALLSALGGLAGLWLGSAARPVLQSLAGAAARSPIVIDWRVAVFSMAVVTAASALIGVWPARRAAAAAPGQALRASEHASAGRHSRRAAGALVVAQTALAALLLIGAGLLVRSLAALSRVDPGFRADGLLTARVEPPWRDVIGKEGSQANLVRRYRAERLGTDGFYAALLTRLRSLPGVVAAAAVNRPPLGGSWWTTEIEIAGRPAGKDASRDVAACRVVTPGYFATLGVPVLQGRAVDDRDGADGALAAVVDASMAALYWPGRSPVGERLRVPDLPESLGGWLTVVGVVGNVRYERLSAEPKPTFYIPLAQAGMGFPGNWGMTLLVRSPKTSEALGASVRAAVRSLDPGLPVFDVRTVTETIDRSLDERRSATRLLALFALVAVALAAIGLGGVLARSVAARTREFGIRVALGARPFDVLGLVASDGLKLTGAGLALGFAAALWATRAIASELFGVSATDPGTFAAIAVLLAAVGLAASLAPALKAMRADPIESLRHR
jgi:putative ABC transport system permease protein